MNNEQLLAQEEQTKPITTQWKVNDIVLRLCLFTIPAWRVK